MKLGKLSKVLKDQVNILKSELQEKFENTSHEIKVVENEKQGLHDKAVFLEKEVNDAKEKIKSTLDELSSAKLDVVLSEQKLEKFCHGDKNIDKMLCMGKTDIDKRGQGYEEPLLKFKTPQITKFVKATASTSVPKHNMISTTHNHSKQMSSQSRGYSTSEIAHGATTAGLTLNSPNHANHFFFYNCTLNPTAAYQIPCANNISINSGYSFATFVHEGGQQNLNNSLKQCESFVGAPVEMDDGVTYKDMIKMDYPEILKKGFLLEWNASHCSECGGSGGRCGFQKNDIICFVMMGLILRAAITVSLPDTLHTWRKKR
ncbi:hypothetical protein GIB67_001362 [Kingdonia uniflora]|uniref:Wall-associated receptor kinase C-terminal domain-containing protein n=1 Tax=Kingdonia uniflora TaxID=39325 RepID=A0A7J7MTN6_9MAGN|nr:hypothetical protein GIB67_001362 [Kingdonia uniflora]